MSDVNLDADADADSAAEFLVRISFVFLKGGAQKNNFDYTNFFFRPAVCDCWSSFEHILDMRWRCFWTRVGCEFGR